MGDLLVALAEAVRALGRDVLDGSGPGAGGLGNALAHLRVQRRRCVLGASRRARLALERAQDEDRSPGEDGAAWEGEWLNYAALLVQVDRIVGDLSAPLPT